MLAGVTPGKIRQHPIQFTSRFYAGRDILACGNPSKTTRVVTRNKSNLVSVDSFQNKSKQYRMTNLGLKKLKREKVKTKWKFDT